jgi:hypothetical protein
MGCNSDFMKGCAGKIKHKTWLAANYFLENEHSDPAAIIYECKCGSFHIGSRKLNSGKKIIKHKKKGNEQQHKRKHKRFKY